ILTSNDAFKLINPIIKKEKREVLFVAYLDSKCNLLSKEVVTKGGVNFVNIPLQEIVKRSLINNSVSLIIFHNHLSGNLIPSKQDIAFTNELKKCLDIVGIKLVDHIIIGDNKFFSFSNENLL
ncbi:MAG: JAB domain-containing protein, partial [Anaeroplasmataceae bacterium]